MQRKTNNQSERYLGGAAEVIVIDLFYRLEVDHTLQLGLVFVCGEAGERENICLFNSNILTTTGFSWPDEPGKTTG